MKALLFILATFILSPIFSQMKITVGQFENGLTYPILTKQSDNTPYTDINAHLLKGLEDLETSAYCISDYGYVQKGNHLQVQIMCTCMEMEKGELRFFFYNLETGKPVAYSDLFDEKKKEEALQFVQTKIEAFKSSGSNACSAAFSALSVDTTFDDLNIRITRDGIEIRVPNDASCEKSPMKISWSELKDYLRYQFL